MTFQPVRVALAEDHDGRLVFFENALVAVLVRLSELHGPDAGGWFLEAGFGALDVAEHPVFPDLPSAEAWVTGRLDQRVRAA